MEFSYWPASLFSFICINVFLTEAGKAGNRGVEKGRRIALMTRFSFIRLVCVKIKIKTMLAPN